MSVTAFYQNHKPVFWLSLWMAIVPLISTTGSAFFIYKYQDYISSFTIWQWSLFYVLTIITMAAALTPTTYIALLSGFFLGLESVLFVVVSYQFASLLGFYIASVIDKDLIEDVVHHYPKSERVFERVKRNQWTGTIFSRLSPALPFALMNVVLSLNKIRLPHFFLGGLIGMLPRSIFFIWIGHEAQSIYTLLENNDYWIGGLLLTAGVVIGFYKLLTTD